MGLVSPPRVDNYRGLYFVSFNRGVEDLVSYLGDAKDYIDLILDQSEEGWRVIPGTQKYSVRANWKMFSLNSLDNYHVRPLHSTFFKYTESLGEGDPPVSPPTEFPGPQGRALSLRNGHGVDVFPSVNRARPIAHWHPILGEESKEEIRNRRVALGKKIRRGARLSHVQHQSVDADLSQLRLARHCRRQPALFRAGGARLHGSDGTDARAAAENPPNCSTAGWKIF